ncbi:MAG: Hsp33 family molecular chaperone HslO [Gammaproteobacteria bacterium]|nr:Hsp33 family molecular chaperone HslO [Gammaproteobacteria bacterium]
MQDTRDREGSSGEHRVIDLVQRFVVEQQSVRGQFVRLGPAWLALREHADYPEPVRRLLGEAVSAAVLLASTLKFEGELTLQLQGNGGVRLLVAQCTHDFRVRGVARFERERIADDADFASLTGEGTIVVTIETGKQASRYQGIVPIGGGSLAASLEHYFENSEQLPTRVVLGADDFGTAGLLVQRMPGQGGVAGEGLSLEAEADRTFAAACEAMVGVHSDELLVRPAAELMRRTFAGLDLRLHGSHAVNFRCRCSAERVEGMLRSLGASEVESIVTEQGQVTVTCEFCHKPWGFDAVDVSRLFGAAADQPPGSSAVN